jgi:hypothetical protein
MKELQDYSGSFIPNLKMKGFSKDAILRLWIATSKLYTGVDGIWMTMTRERFGNEVACELDREIWTKRGTPVEIRRIREAMNIWGDDVESLFKYFQIHPQLTGLEYEIEYDLKNKNHGIYTIKRCKSLEYFERHNEDPQIVRYVCQEIDWPAFQLTAHTFNPNMKVTPLKMPPRKSKDEFPHCQWEFKIE